MRGVLTGLRRDRRGVSTVEFALLAPVLIVLYFGVGELCEGMMAQRRVAHSAAAIGDLVTQNTSVSASQMSDIFSAAAIILQPFPTNSLQQRVTSVTVNAQGNPAVDWSCATGGLAPYTVGSTYRGLPSGIVQNQGESVVVSEGRYKWSSPANYVVPGGIALAQTSYFQPRQSGTITGPQSC